MSFPLFSIEIEKPRSLLAFLVLVVALCIQVVRFLQVMKVIDSGATRGMWRKFICKTGFMGLAISCFILAYAGVSWGTSPIPVQKTGDAVAFVFDISYSMMATDGGDGKTRLQSAAEFSRLLLERMENTSTSVVLAKGEGIVSVPLTNDRKSVLSLLDNLSPELMTAGGTSLGKGVEAALLSFPSQSAEALHIWLFTDGEETDSTLSDALLKTTKFGIPVTVIGFGTENGADIAAGDRTTNVHSSLQSDKLLSLARHSDFRGTVKYMNATDKGCAYRMLRELGQDSENTSGKVYFEEKRLSRHGIFIEIGIGFLLFALILGEIDIGIRRRPPLQSVAASMVFLVLLSSCSAGTKDRLDILGGSLEWNRKDYEAATAVFLGALERAEATGNEELKQYALYNLATTYMMQNERDATVKRFSQIAPDANKEIKFSVFYNSGILAHRNGDYESAARFFREALRIDSMSVDAKINFELSMGLENAKKNSGAGNMSEVSLNEESDTLESAVYSIVREKEQQEWKNRQQSDTVSGADDY